MDVRRATDGPIGGWWKVDDTGVFVHEDEERLYSKLSPLDHASLLLNQINLPHINTNQPIQQKCTPRYLPVPTPQVYWHRIQAGHITLNAEEEDEISRVRSKKGLWTLMDGRRDG